MALMKVDGEKLDAGMRATADAIRERTGWSGDIPWDQDGGTGFAGVVSEMAAAVHKYNLTLPASWSAGSPHTQTVTIQHAGANSQVDLQADAATIEQLVADGTQALYIENNNGVFTACAIGSAPSAPVTVQYTVTEVTTTAG